MIKRITNIFLILVFLPSVSYAAQYQYNFPSPNRAIPYPTINYNSGYAKKLIDKGEYLAKIGDCISCHTNTTKVGSPAFAGDFPMPVPIFGTFYTPNITPDKEAGIGNWTDEQFYNAMHNGINAHGKNLYPVFPYIYFNRVTKEDILAIKAYLFSIPPVNQKKREDDILFPLKWRFLQWGWKALFFLPDNGTFKPDPNRSDSYNRGAYLVEGLGHCSMCHTETNILGGPKKNLYLQGNQLDNYYALDITSMGLHGYSVDEIVHLFKSGTMLGGQGKVIGPMKEVIHNSLQYLTDDDLRAIAEYLKTVSGPKIPNDPKGIYKAVCSHCHDEGLEGAPRLDGQANWSYRLRTTGKKQLIENAINGFNNMPPKGGCGTCTDAEIRQVVEFMLSRSLPSDKYPKMEVVPTAPPSGSITSQVGNKK